MHLIPEHRRTPPYIGDSDVEILAYINKLASAVAKFGHADLGLTADDAALIFSSRDAYAQTYGPAKGARRNRGSVAVKNEARNEADRVARLYAQLIKRNPNVPRAVKVEAGIRLDKKTRTPNGVPRTFPILHVTGNSGNVTTLTFKDVALPTLRLPREDGVTHLMLYAEIAIDGQFTRTESALRVIMTPTRNPVRIRFDLQFLSQFGLDGSERGLAALFRARWVTNKGLWGPMGLPVSYTVPLVRGKKTVSEVGTSDDDFGESIELRRAA